MIMRNWLNEPVGSLEHGRRTVLVVASTPDATAMLMEAVSLVAADHRVATFFTVAPGHDRGVLRGLPTMSRQHEFDLVLAAEPGDVALAHGKTLLLPSVAGEASARVLNRATLGRVVPDALALSHDSERDVLREFCPEVLDAAVVVGDLCYDRLLASIPFRAGYRRALGLSREQRLVAVTSGWHGVTTLDLLGRLLAGLPPERYRVAAAIHPDAWAAHGRWQIRAWLTDCLRAGLLLLPPGEGWQATLVAADLVIGDHGAVTRYGAGIGLPVMTAEPSAAVPAVDVPFGAIPAGATELLGRHARPLLADQPLRDQMDTAIAGDRRWQDGVAARITSRVGRAGENLRREMYRLLGLTEPARVVPCLPVPLPRFIHDETDW